MTVSVSDGKDAAGSPDDAADATIRVIITVTDVDEQPVQPAAGLTGRPSSTGSPGTSGGGDRARSTTGSGQSGLASLWSAFNIAALVSMLIAGLAALVALLAAAITFWLPVGGWLWLVPIVARRRRPAAPVAPVVGTSVAFPKTALDVHWQAAAAAVVGRTSYAVQYRPQGTWRWATQTCDGATPRTTLRDLHPATSYEVRVRAIVGGGASRWTAAGAYSTRAAARPITVAAAPVTVGWEAGAQQQPVPITVIPAPVVVGWTAAA